MDYNESMKLFESIRHAGNKNDEDWSYLYTEFLNGAVGYAHTRAKWSFMSPEEIGNEDERRTREHDDFISSIAILARYAKGKGYDASWEAILERDRKDIGDFACYIHAIIGIEHR